MPSGVISDVLFWCGQGWNWGIRMCRYSRNKFSYIRLFVSFLAFTNWILQIGELAPLPGMKDVFFFLPPNPPWMMACHFELLHLWLCMCVCPFVGQVSLKTSPKHRSQGKHFHIKPRFPLFLSLAEFTLT